MDSEEELRELEEFRVWNFLFSFLKEKLNNTSIDVDLYGQKTCLKVEVPEAGTKYCVMLSRRTSALPQGSGAKRWHHRGAARTGHGPGVRASRAGPRGKGKRGCRGGPP